MNKTETIALYERGREAWNAWAESMSAERATLEAAGQWVMMKKPEMTGRLQGNNEATERWRAAATADFSAHIFEEGHGSITGFEFPGIVRFTGATFSGTAWFSEAMFSGTAAFTRARFSGDVMFDRATFSSDAWFTGVTFSGTAWFKNATFSGTAWFNEATFSDTAWFALAVFESSTSFEVATFMKDTIFVAMTGESFFTLQGVTFFQVPDFEQAHFAEAPRLDIAHYRLPHDERPRFRWLKPGSNKPDVAARWRALKRLAIQAHDREREQIFFIEEVKALRGVQDRLLPNPLNLFRKGKPVWSGGGRYWAGLFYQTFSNFGRSMLRPLVGWVGAVLGFALYYLSRHSATHVPVYPTAGRLAEHVPYLGADLPVAAESTLSELSCIEGLGEAWAAALYLAVHKGLIFVGLGASEKLSQAYACLYGGVQSTPYAVVYAGLGQTVFSAIMVFLFLFAVRNHFRIK